MKKLLSVLLCALLALQLVACGAKAAEESKDAAPAQTEAAKQEVKEEAKEEAPAADADKYPKTKFVAAIPITGNSMQYGEVYKNSIQMAVDEFNADGGLNGTPVELVFYDDKTDQKEAVNIANMVCDDDQVFATLGSFGSALTMAAAPTYQAGGKILYSPNCSHNDFPSIGNLMISYSSPSYICVAEGAKMIYEDLDAPDTCIIYQGTELGVSASEVYQETYEACGGKILANEMFVPGETKDFTPILSKFKELGMECLYINCDYADEATIIMQAKKLGIDCPITSDGQCVKAEFLELVGETDGVSNAEGLIVTGSSPCFDQTCLDTHFKDNELVMGYVNNYKKLYPDAPMDTFGSFAYDATNMILYAAREVGTGDALKLADAIRSIPCELTSSETITYEDGVCIKTPIALTVKDGAWYYYHDINK